MGWLDWWPGARGHSGVNEQRWVMLDVETSGLDPYQDRLLALAAIALKVDWERKRLSVDLGDSFEVVLRQAQVTNAKDNILLHGIGVQSQREGMEPVQALEAFAGYVGASPLLAFHAAFDQTLILRHMKLHLGRSLPNPWVDIEQLCAVTHEKVRARSLDEWMRHFGIECTVRHQAAADTLAECELLLRVWPRLAGQCRRWADVERLARQQRWIARA
ncbi:MAG: 3'-5' exonuclease [Hylemonella sp.]|uniref:3'-5' exonuclease n=1 Tax=Hylemonella sp. TaxID=2066020 RepID=UPI0022C25562|nr:3'-5' exonuclease [Hylemonella sp.]MCZ8251779.1 3'-5' exonuclease [Hylemonella sp.]